MAFTVKFHEGKNPPPRFAKQEFFFENEYGGTLMKPLFANSYQIYFKSGVINPYATCYYSSFVYPFGNHHRGFF